MVNNILGALRRIKADVVGHWQASMIERLGEELGHVWRQRTLGPVVTIQAFLMQLLHGNTACNHVSHRMGRRFTGEAYGQARARLPLALFERLLAAVCQSLASCREEAARWCGLRVWLLDGSGCWLSDTAELQRAFGQPGGQKPGCGFPVVHLLTLFHATTGLLQKVIVSPLRTHDPRHASQMHPELASGDVLVGDRGFCSFAHLAQLVVAGFQGVMLIRQRVIVDFCIGRMHVPPSPPFPKLKGVQGLPRSRWVKWLGHGDQIVEWHKPHLSATTEMARRRCLRGVAGLVASARAAIRPGERGLHSPYLGVSRGANHVAC